MKVLVSVQRAVRSARGRRPLMQRHNILFVTASKWGFVSLRMAKWHPVTA